MVDQIKADYAKLYADVGKLNINHAKFDRLIAEVDVADMHVTKLNLIRVSSKVILAQLISKICQLINRLK